MPGGVYSIEELRAAIARDPIVAAHYRQVDVAAMRAVTLPAGRAAYLSYRRGDRTYWTRERVWLKAGEPAHGELDDFVVPPTPDTGVDSFAADAEAGLGRVACLVSPAAVTGGRTDVG